MYAVNKIYPEQWDTQVKLDRLVSGIKLQGDAIMLIRANRHAVVPTKNHPYDSGVDLTVIEPLPKSPLPDITCPLDTGWYIFVSQSFRGLVMPVSRSGLSIRGVTVANAPGIIDPDYCGPLRIITRSCYNLPVNAGQRVAQLVTTNPDGIIWYIDELQNEEELRQWVNRLSVHRGIAGYGSSGT